MNLKSLRQKAKHYGQLIKHFQNPVLILFVRLGWIDIKYCSYHIRKDRIDYDMLARARGGDLWILREVLVEETYRPVLKLLPPRPIRVLDIGAHIGAFTIWLHRQHGVHEAFCFEPDSDSFSLCQFNLQQNGCNGVRPYQQAIGGSTRESEIWMDTVTHARSTLHKRVTSSAPQYSNVQVIALNEWLEEVQGNFDLLKMDCEGSEWEILDAAPAAFTRFSIIVAEIHADPNGKRTINDFAIALSQHGFKTVSSDKLYIGRCNADAARL
jgi:FkbM family methyltransferase